MDVEKLIGEALKARERAYCPYSGFAVGAALLAADGRIYQGCNIENASYSPTNCAERTAFFTAVAEGVRDFTAIAIVGKNQKAEKGDYCAPCGVCRQVMAEFCDPNGFQIILAVDEKDYKAYCLRELLPLGFTKEDMGRQEIQYENV